MLNNKEPNPLNFFNLRKLKVPPRHFEYINLQMKYNLEDALVKWIEEHLKGRFYVGKTLDVNNGTITTLIKVGFEEPKEISYFTLACPHLKY
tara:strand:+ start:4623 stop:4898 length:276 start_codon:yes stop_codon:yes gene_type:complete